MSLRMDSMAADTSSSASSSRIGCRVGTDCAAAPNSAGLTEVVSEMGKPSESLSSVSSGELWWELLSSLSTGSSTGAALFSSGSSVKLPAITGVSGTRLEATNGVSSSSGFASEVGSTTCESSSSATSLVSGS